MSLLSFLLQYLNPEPSLIADDFNIDLLKYEENVDTEGFINNLYEHLSHLYLNQRDLI